MLVRQKVRVTAQHDVGTTAGHVGGHRDGAAAPGLRDDGGFLFVVLGVEHIVRNATLGELSRKVFGAFNTRGTDEDGLSLLVPLHHIVDNGDVLGFLGLVDEVGLVLAHHRPVGGDGHHTELVDLVELGRLGLGSTGHAGELVVETEVVLQGDGGQRLVLGLDLHPLLGLDGLVHALVVTTPHQHTAGELVDDQHLTLAHDVVLVAGEQFLGLDGVVQVAHQRRVGRLVQIVDAQLVFDELHAQLVHPDSALADVHLVVGVLLHQGDDPCELGVPIGRAIGRARDDQRGSGLVDEDRVDLVDDGEGMSTLHQLVERMGHVVAQIVEAELIVGAVGDVGVVRVATLQRGHLRQDHAHIQP